MCSVSACMCGACHQMCYKWLTERMSRWTTATVAGPPLPPPCPTPLSAEESRGPAAFAHQTCRAHRHTGMHASHRSFMALEEVPQLKPQRSSQCTARGSGIFGVPVDAKSAKSLTLPQASWPFGCSTATGRFETPESTPGREGRGGAGGEY